MKTQSQLLLLFLLLHICAYSQKDKTITMEKVKQEILLVEKNFCNDLNTLGVAEAFYKYAAKDAVIKRENDALIKGSTAIRDYYSKPAHKGAVVEWKPDFIDVSDDGSMAYTYGNYKWTINGKDGKPVTFEGVFHTIWKKQKDGSWKYVWD